MIIKKFQGKTKEDAIALAKKELGDNVVVLTDRVIRPKWYQLFKSASVEITVAKEEEEVVVTKQNSELAQVVAKIDSLREQEEHSHDKASAPATPKTEETSKATSDNLMLNEKLDNIQNLLQEKLKHSATQKHEKELEHPVEEDMPQKEEAQPKEELNSEMSGFLDLLLDTMLENEVNEAYAKEMIADVKQNLHNGMEMEYILSQIYQKMILQFGKAECITPATGNHPKLVYFIGPTGVGKTTTLAKIASQLSIMEGKKIALFTADTYRISATDQLKTYANILKVPFHVIYSVEEMKTNYELYQDYDYILVDTAGHSHHNEEQREAMNSFVHAFDEQAEKEVFLVLSATTKYRDLISITETYKEMTEFKLIFTKLDETSTYGNLLNLRIHTGAGLSYITCGQNVPDDMYKFDPQDTVKKLLSTP